ISAGRLRSQRVPEDHTSLTADDCAGPVRTRPPAARRKLDTSNLGQSRRGDVTAVAAVAQQSLRRLQVRHGRAKVPSCAAAVYVSWTRYTGSWCVYEVA